MVWKACLMDGVSSTASTPLSTVRTRGLSMQASSAGVIRTELSILSNCALGFMLPAPATRRSCRTAKHAICKHVCTRAFDEELTCLLAWFDEKMQGACQLEEVGPSETTHARGKRGAAERGVEIVRQESTEKRM